MDNIKLEQYIIKKIKCSKKQRVSVADYIEICLYNDKWGYYNNRINQIGKLGDFFTNISVGEVYGRVWANIFYQKWLKLDPLFKENIYIIEQASHFGFFAKDILSCMDIYYPELFDNIKYIIIEPLNKLKAEQKIFLDKYIDKVLWVRNIENVSELTKKNCDFYAFYFCNELIDAFPVQLISYKKEELKEYYIGVKEGKLYFILDNIGCDYIIGMCGNIIPQYKGDSIVEINYKLEDYIKVLYDNIQRGEFFINDYGHFSDSINHYKPSTLRTYFNHQKSNELESIFNNIGNQDITSDVNFTHLMHYANKVGFKDVKTHNQGRFLIKNSTNWLLQLSNDLQTNKISYQDYQKTIRQFNTLTHPDFMGSIFYTSTFYKRAVVK